MSIPAALLLSVAGLLLVTFSLCLPYIAAYTRGFRRDALALVVADLERRAPDRDLVKLEAHVHLRWESLIEVAGKAAVQADDATREDRALTVLLGREDDADLLREIGDQRDAHQQFQLQVLSRQLERTVGLADVVMGTRSWVGVRQRRLFWLSVKAFFGRFFNYLRPQITASVSDASVIALAVTVLASIMIGLAIQKDVIGDAATWAGFLFGLAAVALVWLPLLLRALRVQCAGTDPRIVRLVGLMLPLVIVVIVAFETLILTGAMTDFKVRMGELTTRWVDRIEISPTAAMVAAVALMDVVALLAVLSNLYVAVRHNHVTWERVRAAGRIVGWSSVIPLSIGLLTLHQADGFPEWVRLWVLFCWGTAFLALLASFTLRRRSVDA